MAEEYSILLQKEKEGAPIKDLVTDFELVCLSFPFQLGVEAKDVVTDDWVEENGEDSFVPDVLTLKAYNVDIEVGYKGNEGTALTMVDSFIDYLIGLDGFGVKLKIYNPHTNIGRQGVRFLKYEPSISFKSNGEEVYTFKITFRVEDPKTRIVL